MLNLNFAKEMFLLSSLGTVVLAFTTIAAVMAVELIFLIAP